MGIGMTPAFKSNGELMTVMQFIKTSVHSISRPCQDLKWFDMIDQKVNINI